MSIFGTILSKIFHHDTAATTQTAANDSAPRPSTGTSAAAPANPAPQSSAPQGSTTSGSAPAAPAGSVDVAAVLDGLAAKNSQKLDWKHSIVDMMKLLDMDSSLAARKTLAEELHYTGDTSDSASMNIWLHKQVMQKLAANGGKLPADMTA